MARFKGGAGSDTFYGTIGTDQINGGGGDDFLTGIAPPQGTNRDTFAAANADLGDVINGGAGNDTIMGFGGADILDGGAGHDRLVGGIGADIMTGGRGSDTFVFNRFDTGLGDRADRITDFNDHSDHLDFSSFHPTGLHAEYRDGDTHVVFTFGSESAEVILEGIHQLHGYNLFL